MNENKIPTAEEFCRLKQEKDGGVSSDFYYEAMQEFALAHTKAALEAAANNIGFVQTTSKKLNSEEYKPFITADDNTVWTIDKKHVLNAYPEDNIK